MLREYREGKNKFQEKSPIITGPKKKQITKYKEELVAKPHGVTYNIVKYLLKNL